GKQCLTLSDHLLRRFVGLVNETERRLNGFIALRNVRAGGDRGQPRILQSEPELPPARIRSAQGQAEAILIIDPCKLSAWGRWPRLGKPSPRSNQVIKHTSGASWGCRLFGLLSSYYLREI